MSRPQPSHRNRLRVLSNVNDKYCVKCVTRLKDCACVSRKIKSLNPSPVIAGSKDLTSKSETVNLHVNSCVVNPELFVKGYPQKKGVNPNYCYHCQRIKCVKDVSCVDHLSSVNLKCPNCYSRSTCRGQIAPILGEVGSPRDQSQDCNSTQRGLRPPLLVQTQHDQVTNCHKLLCKSVEN